MRSLLGASIKQLHSSVDDHILPSDMLAGIAASKKSTDVATSKVANVPLTLNKSVTWNRDDYKAINENISHLVEPPLEKMESIKLYHQNYGGIKVRKVSHDVGYI